MKESLRDYARLGLVHHMLYGKSLADSAEHARTLQDFARRADIETLDCCLPYGPLREPTAKVIRESGKVRNVFATHHFPLRKISFCSTLPADQAQARLIAADMVDQAALMGATGFIFASGGPRPREAKPENYQAFVEFCRWLCAKLKPHGIKALLEPFDMEVDKCFLMGTTKKCMEILDEVGADNIGIELDVAHLPIMGEDIAEAIRTVAPRLDRVHLGNAMLKDKSDPFYGDNHPPIGYPGGEIDVPELVVALQALLEVGFLSRENRGDVVLELNPFPGKTVDESVADNFARVQAAWAQVQPLVAA
ncbi:MAG: sugar phosphate isomerase/epimerase [Verrucomicrobium sp.]|nr:sugar phosphate isomerase/epimerase [Verrucomicrobium sp.]